MERAFFQKTFTVSKTKGGVNSPFNDAVERVMLFLGEDPTNSKRFGYWCGRLSGASVSSIDTWLKNNGTNKIKLFMWHVKKHNEKKRLSTRDTTPMLDI